mmetsp:Transcript_4900/g.11104  ORF Transcript_4900/g.11104 Transcript_4900/m.11104 type:complete len:156 (-) Transcript_4900:136-603(-)
MAGIDRQKLARFAECFDRVKQKRAAQFWELDSQDCDSERGTSRDSKSVPCETRRRPQSTTSETDSQHSGQSTRATDSTWSGQGDSELFSRESSTSKTLGMDVPPFRTRGDEEDSFSVPESWWREWESFNTHLFSDSEDEMPVQYVITCSRFLMSL